jgi:hypothetical protein
MIILDLGFDSQSLKVVPKLNKGLILVRESHTEVILKVDRVRGKLFTWDNKEKEYLLDEITRDIQFGYIKIGKPVI